MVFSASAFGLKSNEPPASVQDAQNRDLNALFMVTSSWRVSVFPGGKNHVDMGKKCLEARNTTLMQERSRDGARAGQSQ